MIRDAPWPNQTKPLLNLLRTGLIFFDPLVTVLKALIWWLDLIVESRHVSKLLKSLVTKLCKFVMIGICTANYVFRNSLAGGA